MKPAVAPSSHSADKSKRIEVECYKALTSLCANPDQGSQFKYIVRTPQCYLYDDTTNTQILEYLHDGINLKNYALQNFPSPTPESFRPQCYQLGKALAQYIMTLHQETEKEAKSWLSKGRVETEPKLYSTLKNNKQMQDLKHVINYDWLLQRIDQFPTILEEAREVFVQVKEMALSELNDTLTPIHGDYWTGK